MPAAARVTAPRRRRTIVVTAVGAVLAYASAFQLQTSTDGTAWTTVYSTTTGTGGTQTLAVSGSGRYVLFKPGSYNVNADLGFHTSIAGLGLNPDQGTINGGVTVDAGWFNGNATQNFWRSASNMKVVPTGGTDRWAVAQAAPFRRMDIQGDLELSPTGYGWASGGYIADSRVSGVVHNDSQQQWFTRDSQLGGFSNGVWNQVFAGVRGAPPQSFPNPPYTVLAQNPVSREEPYLYVDSAGAYSVFVPSLLTNSAGTTWAGGNTPGSSISLDQFYVTQPGDSAARINQAPAEGLNLLVTPGVYHLSQTLNVNRANTVSLGSAGAIKHVIDETGAEAQGTATVPGYLVSYP